MIKPIIFLFSCVISFSFLQAGKIEWNKNRLLTWRDFQGIPDKNSPFVAKSQTGIHFKYSYTLKENSVDVEFSVNSFFNRKKSWKKSDRVSSHVLKHEQTHFDITELHARKFRKKLEDFSFTKDVKNEIEQLYLQMEEERTTMQKQFDAESNHSRNREKEFAWRKFVAKELNKYEFKNK